MSRRREKNAKNQDKIKTVGDLKKYISQIGDDVLLRDVRIKQIKPHRFSASINIAGIVLASEDEAEAHDMIEEMFKESKIFQALSDKETYDVFDVEREDDEDDEDDD